MNKLNNAERVQVIAALVEGNSINSTSRMTGISKPTILKLLADLGKACDKLHYERVRNIEAKHVQADEIWAFVYAKQKNVPVEMMGRGYGDCWTWTCIDADTKLMISYAVGARTPEMAQDIMDDLASRIVGRPQITTDALKGYFKAVMNAFEGYVDHAIMQKIYGLGLDRQGGGGGRYSPPVCTGYTTRVANGNPDPDHISTSFIERSNLTLRMGMRRFTRLTNGFSKKIENHRHMVAIFFAYYNFCRIHQTLRMTPAMKAGLTSHVWKIEELVNLLPVESPKKRSPYKVRATPNI